MTPVTDLETVQVQYARRRWLVFVLALAFGTILDLGTKAWAFETLGGIGEPRHLTSFFALTKATNPGAAFGMFRGKHTFFMIVTVVAFVAVPYFVHVAREKVLLVAVVLGLILSGVVGNFWDRMVYGEVRDFLDFHTPATGTLHDLFDKVFGSTVWPTFNVADMFITGGAFGIVGGQWYYAKDDEKTEDGEEKEPSKDEEPEKTESSSEPEPKSESEPKSEPEPESKPESEPKPEETP